MSFLCLYAGDLVSIVSLVISILAFGLSWYFWRRQFRPIVTVAVKTHSSGNVANTYDLVFMNSGSIPAKNIKIKLEGNLPETVFGEEGNHEHRIRWLACFSSETSIAILQNGEQVRCSFGFTKADDKGFWRYRALIQVRLVYEGWFGRKYSELQTLKIVSSDSFTDYAWNKSDQQ